jgi:outer membrane receptor protein involved in Fe transport
MACRSLVRHATLVAAVATLGVRAGAQQAPPPGPAAEISLDSLLNTHISAASKYAQTSSAAAGDVTIVSSEDIRNYGYRNLQEVLENVRGFYVSNDRNYAYLGVRGFGRTTDYNSRVLLLIDGHAMNEQLWGSTPIGADLPINFDAVERIEVVQGPGSALYGTGAVFAVINIVTKTALALDGGVARVGMGAAGEHVAALTAGHSFGSGVSLTGSGLLTTTKGGDLYFPAYDTPATLNGIARGLDWEHAVGGYGTLTWSELTVRTGYRRRAKGIPTGEFGSLFGDSRAQSVDANLWGDVALQHEWNGALTFSGRLYADRYDYHGVYPYDLRPQAYSDAGGSTAAGTELMMRWAPISRVRLTIGTDDKLVTRSAYAVRLEDGTVTSANAPFHVLSGFAQGELQLHPSAMLVAGVRTDHYSSVGSATTPRLALILTPHANTTIKLLYGEAFRAPSPGQGLFTVGIIEENLSLAPERFASTELNIQQRLSGALLLGVSAYRYQVDNLIDQQPTTTGTVRFQNFSHAEAKGLELQLDVRPTEPVSARLSYALQKTVDAQGIVLTNSPQQLANLGVTARADDGLRAAVQLRYESARRTRAAWTSPFLRTDMNLGYRPGSRSALSRFGNSEISLRVTNLFDVAYATPVGPAYLQDSIAADGRAFALRLEWHF